MPFKTLPWLYWMLPLTHKAFKFSRPPSSAPLLQRSHLRQCLHNQLEVQQDRGSRVNLLGLRTQYLQLVLSQALSLPTPQWLQWLSQAQLLSRATHSEIPARLWFLGREYSWRIDIKMPTLMCPCFSRHSKLNCCLWKLTQYCTVSATKMIQSLISQYMFLFLHKGRKITNVKCWPVDTYYETPIYFHQTRFQEATFNSTCLNLKIQFYWEVRNCQLSAAMYCLYSQKKQRIRNHIKACRCLLPTPYKQAPFAPIIPSGCLLHSQFMYFQTEA